MIFSGFVPVSCRSLVGVRQDIQVERLTADRDGWEGRYLHAVY